MQLQVRAGMSETDGTDDLWRGDIGATADAFGVLGLRLRLEQVLLEISRTGRAMADGREPSAETRDRLEALRREASSLEKAIYGANLNTPPLRRRRTLRPAGTSRPSMVRRASPACEPVGGAASAMSSRSTSGTLTSMP